ncbi:hypothetical protein N7508_007401 [Penicillium antarcticum]|uniref:uncharacterized protein n=1 Tax=Penicillium antarcticum TaxID=416450 RepID=UPI00238DFECB|nr:uncharacterized protein N7508_007401 [Penicillium antarcticum]KAJ5300158.1 hypothetical protein N7508_007401 [Penicillium antarcticum]
MHYQGPPLPSTDLIPCKLDLVPGSSLKAKERKANNGASRRYRVRKRKQEDILNLLDEQEQNIKDISERCDHYKSERDFYRDLLGHYIPLEQLPLRPTTPQDKASTETPTAIIGTKEKMAGSGADKTNEG